MKSLVVLIAAVCIGVAVGDNSPLLGALKFLQPHINLETRSVHPRQEEIFGTCTEDDLIRLARNPPACAEEISVISGDSMFNDLLDQNPATLTEIYSLFCQPNCGDPILRIFYACDLDEIANAVRYVCSANAAGSRCYQVFDPLLADASAAVSSCSSSTTSSCTASCSAALTTLSAGSGCCVNFLNNSMVVTTAASTLDFDLWDECDVAVPDFCALDTSSLSSAMAVTLSKILFVGLLFAVVVFIP